MKKTGVWALALAVVGIFSTTGHAGSVGFGDTNKYWGDNSTWAPGEKWNTDVANPGWNGNNIDVIGDPDIKGGTADFTAAGRLQKIAFNYSSPYTDWRMLAPGNLFVNVVKDGSDTTWDYVVNTMGNASLNKTDPKGNISTLAAGDYAIYNISGLNIDARRGKNDASYIKSGADNVGEWAGYYLRNNHPIGIDPTVLNGLAAVGSAYYSGFPGTNTIDGWNKSSYYSFYGDGLDLQGHDIIIGWEMTCANDVLYEKVNNPVPEPATMLLFGTGLAGLATIARSRKKN